MTLHQRLPALLGGSPAFAEVVHVGRPNVMNRQRVLERIGDALDRRWLSNHGPLVQEFEAALARQLQVRHVLAVCNATIGLQVAARALGLRGEVIMPSYTFVATAHALEMIGLEPVFADIDPSSHGVDPRQVACLMGPRTGGIVGVHLWGRACDVSGLQALADSHGVPLMFDAAHAFGCTTGGIPIGRFGRCEVFSFHATKFVNAFEGGAVATDDDELAARLALQRNFGFADYDQVVSGGTNAKMSEASAAMGLTSLESLESILAVNRSHHERYAARLHGIPGVRLLRYPQNERNNWQYVVIEAAAPYALTRDELIAFLRSENVLARRYFWPGCHAMEPYRTRDPAAAERLPNTVDVAQRVVVLPTGTGIDEAGVDQVADLIRMGADAAWAARLRARLADLAGGGA